jgi:hypothetical protein
MTTRWENTTENPPPGVVRPAIAVPPGDPYRRIRNLAARISDSVDERPLMMVTPARRRGRWRWSGFGTRTWRGLGYLLLGVPSTVLAWVVAVVVAVVMSVTVVGAAVTPVLLAPVRAAAGLERLRCAMVLGGTPARPYRPAP